MPRRLLFVEDWACFRLSVGSGANKDNGGVLDQSNGALPRRQRQIPKSHWPFIIKLSKAGIIASKWMWRNAVMLDGPATRI
jgi:hypothetical protein